VHTVVVSLESGPKPVQVISMLVGPDLHLPAFLSLVLWHSSDPTFTVKVPSLLLQLAGSQGSRWLCRPANVVRT
jgi:hypothetical protein